MAEAVSRPWARASRRSIRRSAPRRLLLLWLLNHRRNILFPFPWVAGSGKRPKRVNRSNRRLPCEPVSGFSSPPCHRRSAAVGSSRGRWGRAGDGESNERPSGHYTPLSRLPNCLRTNEMSP